MSRGAQPYSEFASLSEVAERIKNGYTMSCPEGCRPELHAEVMLPCWRPQESKRPGFAALCHTLESLGATPLEVERARRPSAQQATTAVYHANEHTPDSSWQADIRDYTMRGPTVYHINSVFCPEVIAAVQPPWKSKGRTLHAPESATIADAVDSFGYQVTSAVVCPRDGEQGCAYVDTLTSRDDVGRAVALLSCELPSHRSFLCLDDDVPLMV